MRKVKEWFIKYKEDILFVWGTAASFIALLLVLFVIALVGMTEDLVGVVETKNKEIEVLAHERNYYFYLADDLQQTYEDVVPKQQYIQDIEFLESVILELRGQCEIELGKKCECQ